MSSPVSLGQGQPQVAANSRINSNSSADRLNQLNQQRLAQTGSPIGQQTPRQQIPPRPDPSYINQLADVNRNSPKFGQAPNVARVAIAEDDDNLEQLPNNESQILQQKQLENPFLQRMRQQKEQQMRQAQLVEQQLRNQQQAQSNNNNNATDSDV